MQPQPASANPLATNSSWDASLYDTKHAFVWKQAASLMELLAPRSGERILDLGCGTGHLTAQLAATGATGIGVDNSPTMIEQAARHYPGLRFVLADARDFTFDEPFDAVFSNAALHWVREPQRVISCVFHALKPGGRFVAEFGGQGNVQTVAAAVIAAANAVNGEPFEHPWYFPSIAAYTRLLEQAGLETTLAILFDRPTPLEGEQGMRDWVTMFAKHAFEKIVPSRHEDFLHHAEELLRPVLYRDGIWYVDYRRLRVLAWRRTL